MTRNGPAFRRRRSSATKEQLREYFEVRFRTEKYGVPYFLAESEAKQSGPRKEAVGARARNAVEDLNVQVIRSYSWAATEEPHNSQCKPVNNCGGSHDFPELQFQIWKSGSRPQNAQPTCYEWI